MLVHLSQDTAKPLARAAFSRPESTATSLAAASAAAGIAGASKAESLLTSVLAPPVSVLELLVLHRTRLAPNLLAYSLLDEDSDLLRGSKLLADATADAAIAVNAALEPFTSAGGIGSASLPPLDGALSNLRSALTQLELVMAHQFLPIAGDRQSVLLTVLASAVASAEVPLEPEQTAVVARLMTSVWATVPPPAALAAWCRAHQTLERFDGVYLPSSRGTPSHFFAGQLTITFQSVVQLASLIGGAQAPLTAGADSCASADSIGSASLRYELELRCRGGHIPDSQGLPAGAVDFKAAAEGADLAALASKAAAANAVVSEPFTCLWSPSLLSAIATYEETSRVRGSQDVASAKMLSRISDADAKLRLFASLDFLTFNSVTVATARAVLSYAGSYTVEEAAPFAEAASDPQARRLAALVFLALQVSDLASVIQSSDATTSSAVGSSRSSSNTSAGSDGGELRLLVRSWLHALSPPQEAVVLINAIRDRNPSVVSYLSSWIERRQLNKTLFEVDIDTEQASAEAALPVERSLDGWLIGATLEDLPELTSPELLCDPTARQAVADLPVASRAWLVTSLQAAFSSAIVSSKGRMDQLLSTPAVVQWRQLLGLLLLLGLQLSETDSQTETGAGSSEELESCDASLSPLQRLVVQATSISWFSDGDNTESKQLSGVDLTRNLVGSGTPGFRLGPSVAGQYTAALAILTELAALKPSADAASMAAGGKPPLPSRLRTYHGPDLCRRILQEVLAYMSAEWVAAGK